MFKGLNKISALEVIIFIIFFLYLIFDFKMPSYINGYIDTPLGIVFILLLVLIIFLYMNPILGILGIFVAYEIIRRSSGAIGNRVAVIDYKPVNIKREFDNTIEMPQDIPQDIPPETTQPPMEKSVESEMVKKDENGKEYGLVPNIPPRVMPVVNTTQNTPKFESTLEEEVVHQMAPLSNATIANYMESDFKPISENIHNASTI